MSFQTFVTERLADLTAKYNALYANVKRIFELPVQNNLDPTSLIHVSRNKISESLSVQKIIDAISAGDYDHLISIGDITVSGTNVTFPANASWVISNTYYQNIADIPRIIPLAAAGLNRIDIAVANTSNDIVIETGEETSGIAVRPNIPVGTVLVTQINVDDSAVGDPSTPVLGSEYVEKIESSELVTTGGHAVFQFFMPGYSSIRFTGSETHVDGVYIFPSYNAYPGKKLTFKNFQSTDILIKHLGPSDPGINTKFWFPTLADFTLKPGQIIEFSYSFTTHRFEFVGSTADLTNYYNKTEIDAKISSVLIYKGSVANYAALPTTGLAIGHVYNLTDTGHNYAWTGTLWDDLGPAVDVSGKEDSSNKSTSTSDSGSSSKFPVWSAIVSFFSSSQIKTILGISTLSGSNTGDETTATLKTKIDVEYPAACSDEITPLLTGTVITFRMPFAMTLSSIRASVNTAPTVSSLIVDVKESGVSIFSTLLSIDATEKTSTTAAVPAVISDVNLADDAELSVSITQIGSGVAGAGLKILLIGKKA